MPIFSPNFDALWRDVWPPDEDVVTSFKHLAVLHKTAIFDPLPATRDNRYRIPDPLFLTLPSQFQDSLKKYVGPYYRASPSRSSVWRSIRKMDVPYYTEYVNHVFFEDAYNFVCDMYFDTFEQSTEISSFEEVLKDMELDSSPGQPWIRMGFKKKKDFFKNREAVKWLIDPANMIMSPDPVIKMSGKVEILHADDLDDDKVRTFLICPLPLVFWGKVCYQKQNESLKQNKWSAYGFNPFRGGVHRMALQLLLNKLFGMYDVKGWDRTLPVMRHIYKFRMAFMGKWMLIMRMIAWWVAKNHIVSFVILPDGHIIIKDHGNNSGSCNTTTDNILGHCIILALVLFDLFNGDIDLVMQVIAYLFGDDDVFSLPDSGKSLEEIETTFHRVFGLFGLSLDPFLLSHDLNDMEFLGFKFHYVDYFGFKGWIPQYKIGRITSAFCYVVENGYTLSACVAKAWTLVVLAAGNYPNGFVELQQALTIYLDSLKKSDDPVVSAFVSFGAPSYEDCLAFYLGYETCTFTSEIEAFFMDTYGRLVEQKFIF